MRPRPRTSLLAAALAAPLLLGIGAAAVGVGAQEDRSSSAKGPTAAGRIGDAAAYDVYWRLPEETGWALRGQEFFHTRSQERVVDELARPHDVLVVEGSQDESSIPDRRYFIDLVDRSVVRVDQRYAQNFDGLYYYVEFGPRLVPDGTKANVLFFALAGRGFASDEEFTEATRNSFHDFAGWRDPRVQPLAYRASLGARGEVGGVRVEEYRVEASAILGLARDWTDSAEFLRFTVPETARLDYAVSFWMDASSAYPAAIHEALAVNGTPTGERFLSRAANHRGLETIRWVDSPVPSMEPVVLERTREGKHWPDDGGGLRYCFPLSEALALAERSYTGAPAFAVWRTKNPDYRLIGAGSWCSRQGEGFWGLVYGTPAGEAYVVTLWNRLQSPEALYVNAQSSQWEGPWKCRPFDAAALPKGLLTWAAAQKMFEQYVDANRSRLEVHSLSWGITGSYAPTAADRTMDAGLGWNIVSVGHSPFELPLNEPAPAHISSLDIDAVNGTLRSASEIDVRWATILDRVQGDAQRLVGVQDAAELMARTTPTEAKAQIAAGIAAWVAVISGSVFLALIVYLYPLLKFAATHAALALPGYAKLNREQLLNNRFRDNLAAAIRADPGITPPNLHRLVGGGWSTIVYHLAVLEKNKLVSSMIDGRHKRFFPADAVDWSKRGAIAALHNARTREVYRLILDDPGAYRHDLAKRLAISAPAALWHLGRLENAGLVAHDKRGRRYSYYAASSLPSQIAGGVSEIA